MIILTLAKRNLKIFFRDKMSVFFSLLSAFIIIGLYVLFLGNLMVSNMKDLGDTRFMMDSWIMAGLLAVTSLTTTMGAFGIMIEDKAKKVLKDFVAAPIKRSSLVGGYVVSSFAIGLIMSVVTFVLAEGYIMAYGGTLLPLEAMLKVFGVLLLGVLASSAMVFFLVSFIKSNNAFATASTIIGTLVGFLTGVYIPVGTLPPAVQSVVKFFPVSHAGALLRQIMMEEPLAEVFKGAPAQTALDFKIELGVIFKVGTHTITAFESILVLLATAVIFYALAIFNVSRKSK